MGAALSCSAPQVADERDPLHSHGPSIGSRAAAELFTLKKLLGEGAWSSCYLVERKEDGRQFALKSTRTSELTEAQRWICVNEIRLMASLHHPNIVQWHEGFLDGPWLCVVMEFVAGGDLHGLIKGHREAGTRIPERHVWSYLLQMVLGLQYMHQTGVAHRDIKPANVLLSTSGVVKLADLGVAGVLRGGTSACQIGTPQYMAPEMFRREHYSYKCDIWSLGCTLHELLTLDRCSTHPRRRRWPSRSWPATCCRCCPPATERSCGGW